MGLQEALQNIWSSDYVQKNPNKAYKTSYGSEYAAVAAYLNGGAEPNWSGFSKMGKGLCEVEKERRLAVPPVDPPPVDPPPVDPPPSGSAIPSNGVIAVGGTYTGAHTGTVTISASSPVTLDGATITNSGSVATVKISTAAAVVIQNSTIKNTSGDISGSNPGMIDAYHFLAGAPDVTLDHCFIEGPDTWVSQRAFVAQNWKRVIIRNCTITNTRGIDLWPNSSPSPTTLITKNRVKNIKGDGTLTNVSNFVQIHDQANAIEISWNEVINEYNHSCGEDIISVFHSSNVYVHDNMLFGQSKPGNTGGSSQGGITLDASTAGPGVNNNRIENNQIVRGNGVVVYPTNANGGSNNVIQGNRVVSAGFLDDGVTRNAYGYQGTHVVPGGANNHAHGNTIGYVSGSTQGGVRRDGSYDGCPEGDAGEWANNTHLAPAGGVITRAHEDTEWTSWQQKLTANNIKLGA